MPRAPKRQPRIPISVSLMHPDWVRTSRAAAMQGMTLSEYGRAVIREANARVLDGVIAAELPPLQAAS